MQTRNWNSTCTNQKSQQLKLAIQSYKQQMFKAGRVSMCKLFELKEKVSKENSISSWLKMNKQFIYSIQQI